MQVDYIIVGLGLAGLAFTKELIENNKSFVVLLYTSMFPEIISSNIAKSKPKLTCSVVSHVKSGFARFRNAIGTLVPPEEFPYFP